MILRLSQKLGKKVKAETLSEIPLDENPYADWSCHLFAADRTQYIILSNTVSLYSCVMFGKGITNDGQFIERALSTIREFMEDDGQQFSYERFIIPANGTISFAKTLNRQVTSSMNELIELAKLYLMEDMSPHDVGFRLNDTLLSAIGDGKAHPYGKPREAFKMLGSHRASIQDGEESGEKR